MTKFFSMRWTIVFLLFLITILNYIDRASIAYAITPMTTLFHLSNNQIGLALGAFGIGYAFMTFLGGILVDKCGARIILSISVIGWALATILTGFSIGFISILLLRMILGLAEGPNFPAMTRAIGDWLPKHERATALSYALLAVPIALAIGGPIVSSLIILISWRGMFILLGIISLLWLPAWWLLFRNRPQQSSYITQHELAMIEKSVQTETTATHATDRKSNKKTWYYLLTTPTLLSNYWGFFVFGYYLFFFMTWLPTYLEKNYHLHLATVGLITMLPWALAALMLWIVGKLSDYIFKKTSNLRWARSYPICLSQLIAALCVLPILFIHQLFVSTVFIALAVGFSISANAPFYAVNIDIAKERAGTALGIMDTAFAISGFLAPAITGWVISLTGNFKTAFIILMILGLSSVIFILLCHNPQTEKHLSKL